MNPTELELDFATLREAAETAPHTPDMPRTLVQALPALVRILEAQAATIKEQVGTVAAQATTIDVQAAQLENPGRVLFDHFGI